MQYPTIHEKLTWEKIRAFPVKRADMTEAEMRDIIVRFLRFTKTALWTPNAEISYPKNAKGTIDTVTPGTVYGGLPYITHGSGNVYRMMDYLDEETGIMDMRDAATAPRYFGNQCSGATYWAWGRFVNSATYRYTREFVANKGFLRVGPYTYDDTHLEFSPDFTTNSICAANGAQVMYQSYAAMQPADGLVNFTTAGHVIMCTAEPHIEYIEGTNEIDGENSYILEIEQAQKWLEATNESGDTYQYKNHVDYKRSFAHLFEKGYIPFAFAELLGTKAVDETQCAFSHTGDTVTAEQLFTAKVTANYGICDVYASFRNAQGREVYRHAVRMDQAGFTELEMKKDGPTVATWGSPDFAGQELTVEISVQLATGERPVVYRGTLVG